MELIIQWKYTSKTMMRQRHSIRGNSLQGLISIESPLGKAIQGHKVGDRVLVRTNGNDGYYVVIKNIDNTTDDSHDTLRKY